jgi:hypothetical protein
MHRLVAVAALLVTFTAGALPGNNPPPPTCTPPAILVSDSTHCRPLTPCPIYKCVVPPASQTGYAATSFFITGVFYAQPGKGSSVAYSSGQQFGSTVTIDRSFKNEINVTASVTQGVIFASGELTVSFGNIWDNHTISSTDMSVEVTDGYKKLGSGDYIDHNEDEVWFMASPHFRLTWTPAWDYGRETIDWSPVPDSETEPYFLYVGELNGKWPLPTNVAAFLNKHGITADDLPEMLKATQYWGDPVPAGLPVDSARYELVAIYPYTPVPYPGVPQSISSHDVKRKNTSSTEQKSTVTYKASIKVGANIGFINKARWTIEDKMEFTTTSSNKLSTTQTDSATLTILQPPYGYTGPTILRVYEDKIHKTFYSQLDWY